VNPLLNRIVSLSSQIRARGSTCGPS